MLIDLAHFTPVTALLGGLLIGLAAALLLLWTGRIAGISGILGGLLSLPRGDMGWRLTFLVGLMGAPILTSLLGLPATVDIEASWSNVLVAGFLVGIGTRFAGGCTSGHGVCGISRGSLRSLVATMTFMTTGLLTVFVQRHLLGGLT